MQVRMSQLIGETDAKVEVTLDWNDPTVDKRSVLSKCINGGDVSIIFEPDKDQELMYAFLRQIHMDSSPYLVTPLKERAIRSMELRPTQSTLHPGISDVICTFTVGDEEKTANCGNYYSSTDFANFFDGLDALSARLAELEEQTLGLLGRAALVSGEVREPLLSLVGAKQSDEPEYATQLTAARAKVVSASDQIGRILQEAAQQQDSANTRQLQTSVQELQLLLQGTLYRFDQKLPSPEAQFGKIELLFNQLGSNQEPLKEAMENLRNQPDMQQQYQVLLKHYERLGTFQEAANGEGKSVSTDLKAAEDRATTLSGGVDHLSPEKLIERAQETYKVATELKHLEPVATALAEAHADMRELYYQEKIRVGQLSRTEQSPQEPPLPFDRTEALREGLALYTQAVSFARDMLPRMLLKQMVFSLSVHVTTREAVVLLTSVSRAELAAVTEEQRAAVVAKLKEQVASLESKKAPVVAQLAEVSARQDRKKQALDVQANPAQRLGLSIASFFAPSDESMQATIVHLTNQREDVDKQLTALTNLLPFLEDPDGGFAQLQALKEKVAAIKTALPATPPTESGE